MRKLLILTLALGCFVVFGACQKTLDEATFCGVVEEVSEMSLLVKVNEGEAARKSSDLISVSRDVKRQSETPNVSVGDEVCVYYDGVIAESYPAQVDHVYQIELVEVAGE